MTCRSGVSLVLITNLFSIIQRGGSRQASYYDPANEEFGLSDTCFGTHHLQFGWGENRMLILAAGRRHRTASILEHGTELKTTVSQGGVLWSLIPMEMV